jgi:hypothetical protein
LNLESIREFKEANSMVVLGHRFSSIPEFICNAYPVMRALESILRVKHGKHEQKDVDRLSKFAHSTSIRIELCAKVIEMNNLVEFKKHVVEDPKGSGRHTIYDLDLMTFVVTMKKFIEAVQKDGFIQNNKMFQNWALILASYNVVSV